MPTQTTLPTRTLGRTGLEVSILGFGAEAIGRNGRSFEDAERTLNAVLDAGVSLIDTASSYGNSEAFIGRAISRRKDEFTLVTKCGWTRDWAPAWSPGEIAATIDRSLEYLQAESLDVLLLHSCPLEALKQGDVITAIQKAQSQGKARFIGYSGDNEALMIAVKSGLFDVIECSFSVLDQANAPAIAEAQRREMGVLIKRPIANAVPGRVEKPRSEYAAQYWPRWQTLGLTSSDIGNVSWLEAAARFSAFWPGVTSILVGSSHAEHMIENVRMLAQGPLPSPIVTRMREAFAKVGSDWAALG